MSAGKDGALPVSRPSEAPVVVSDGAEAIDGLAISPDESVAAAMQGTRVRLWDLQPVRLRGSVEVGLGPGLGRGIMLSFPPDGRSLAVMAAMQGSSRVWRARSC